MYLLLVSILAIGPCFPEVVAEESEITLFVFREPKKNCILPLPPENGNYTFMDWNPSAKPGNRLPSYALKVECDPGYHLVGDRFPICLDGLDAKMPECLRRCIRKTPDSVSCGEYESCYFVQVSGKAEETTELRSTTINSVPERSQSQLDDDYECGKVLDDSGILAGGTAAVLKDLPWQAAVYSKLSNPYMQICGGSLVSRSVVISAAHCFWGGIQKLPAENYAVAVGKLYRPWNDKNDINAQKSDVRAIHIPPRFLGGETRFQEDLALLTLTTPVSYGFAVRPVCLDFDYDFDKRQLTNGALGKVGGWGLVSEDGRASPTLQIADMPYISIEKCVSSAEPSFREYITCDKICAGYTNGTAVCKGDSGGGLSFSDSTGAKDRYYLRGVVSSAPRSDHLCAVFHWATFTHLQRHQHFIQEIMGLKSGTKTRI